MNFGNIIKYISWIIMVMVFMNGCSRGHDIESENKKIKQKLLTKIKKEIKLSTEEINNLVGILVWEGNYDEGIKILETLKDSEKYLQDRYTIYFALAVLYAEKLKDKPNIRNQQNIVKKVRRYLSLGFKFTPKIILAYYLRGKVYASIGCKNNAIKDLNVAISKAKEKEIIYLGEGIYLERNKFIKFMQKEIERIQKIKEECIY